MEENNKNANQNNQQTPPPQAPVPPKKSKKGQSFILILLVIMLGVVTWLYLDQRKTTDEIESYLTAEKDTLEMNLKELRSSYDSIQTDNDTLNAMLLSEQEKIDELITEIKTVKATNFARIRELEDELGTMRKVAKSYVRQIDSLNTMNKELIAENIKVRGEMQEAISKNEELSEKNEDLSSKVEKASVLRTMNLNAMPLNDRGKEKTKVNKVAKIKVCFTIKENVLVEAGERTVYMRIAGPDDYILAKSEEDLFDLDEKLVVYSAKRPVDFDGKDTDLCIFYDNDGELLPGTYDVYLFADGYEIGTTSFTLEDSGWF